MPVLYKPQLTEQFSHATVSSRLFDDLMLLKEPILKALGFYDEHGCIGDHGGGFDAQRQQAETDVIKEIAGALAEAATVSMELPPGVLIATLRKVRRFPKLVREGSLPGAAERFLAKHYRRDIEALGTYWRDITAWPPLEAEPVRQIPTDENIKRAALAAIAQLEANPRRGRPKNQANEILAIKLRPLFLCYNNELTRQSAAGSGRRSEEIQVEDGRFVRFLQVLLSPLRKYLLEMRLTSVSDGTIAKNAQNVLLG